jgi:hypothetical protein
VGLECPPRQKRALPGATLTVPGARGLPCPRALTPRATRGSGEHLLHGRAASAFRGGLQPCGGVARAHATAPARTQRGRIGDTTLGFAGAISLATPARVIHLRRHGAAIDPRTVDETEEVPRGRGSSRRHIASRALTSKDTSADNQADCDVAERADDHPGADDSQYRQARRTGFRAGKRSRPFPTRIQHVVNAQRNSGCSCCHPDNECSDDESHSESTPLREEARWRPGHAMAMGSHCRVPVVGPVGGGATPRSSSQYHLSLSSRILSSCHWSALRPG